MKTKIVKNCKTKNIWKKIDESHVRNHSERLINLVRDIYLVDTESDCYDEL